MGRNRVRFVYDKDLEKCRYRIVRIDFGEGLGMNVIVQADLDEDAIRIAKEREPGFVSYEIAGPACQRFYFDDKHIIR